jgi:hypothetical protein
MESGKSFVNTLIENEPERDERDLGITRKAAKDVKKVQYNTLPADCRYISNCSLFLPHENREDNTVCVYQD